MRKNIILDEVVRILEINKLDFDENSPITHYNNWDSLFTISMIAIIDEKFDIAIKGHELEKCQTVNDILKLIEEK